MTEAEWLTCQETYPMLSHVGADIEQRKTLLLFAACCESVWDQLPTVCREWIELLRDVAEGRASPRDLDRTWTDFESEFTSLDGPDERAGGRFYSVINLVTAGGLGYWADDCPPERGGPRWEEAEAEHAGLVREIYGNPFRPTIFSPEWRTDTAVALARTMYESRDFSAMPILADALQDAGCDNQTVLDHCRGPGPHVRGCWVCDRVLGNE